MKKKYRTSNNNWRVIFVTDALLFIYAYGTLLLSFCRKVQNVVVHANLTSFIRLEI